MAVLAPPSGKIWLPAMLMGVENHSMREEGECSRVIAHHPRHIDQPYQ